MAKHTGVRMISNRYAVLAAALCLGAIQAGADEEKPRIRYKPLMLTGVQEVAQIQSGMLISEPIQPMKKEWIDHFGSSLRAEAVVNDRLLLQLGLGGVFENGKPERIDDKFGGSQYKMFFIGPTIAKATAMWGDPEKPSFTLGGGLFPFKYNPQAADLGEYLFRSGPYPTYVMNGGMLSIGDNGAYLEGFQGSAHLGSLNVDLLAITETGMPPLYDWSIAILADYTLGDGLLTLGAGVNFKRLIPVNKDRTSRKEGRNAYFTRGGITYVGDETYYKKQADFYNYQIMHAAPGADTSIFVAKRNENKAKYDSLIGWQVPDPANSDIKQYPDSIAPLKYFTPAGTVFMARANLDLKHLFNSEALGHKDLMLFAEAALLGWTNYPIFFEKRAQRIPIMAGINLPTWKVLDLLSVQVEHLASPFQNNTYSLGARNHATPWFPDGTDLNFSGNEYNDGAKKDDWAWSVLAQRSFYKSVTLSAQVARDHLRTVGTDWYYGSRLEPTEDLHKISDWYWALQLAWAI
ncbi:MAG TPA: hypothetical protein VJ385_12575 [Fibrobacteria bacterium]|nr:hypothetical protein [Fibrobacteria bacterium]